MAKRKITVLHNKVTHRISIVTTAAGKAVDLDLDLEEAKHVLAQLKAALGEFVN